MGVRELRAKYEVAFTEFWEAYPRHTDRQEAFTSFIEVAEEGFDVDAIIAKARSYSQNVDPEQLKYVPGPHRWLKNRRWEDNDLFTDERSSKRAWLENAWRNGDAAAVEAKYGYVYPDPQIPPDVKDIQAWCLDDRKAWIAGVANHLLHRKPLPE